MELSSTKHSLTLTPPPVIPSYGHKDLRKGYKIMAFGVLVMISAVPFLMLAIHLFGASMDDISKATLGVISGTAVFSLGLILLSFGEFVNVTFIQEELSTKATNNTKKWKNEVLLPYLSDAYGVEIISELQDDLTCRVTKNGESFLARIEGVTFETKISERAIYLSAQVDYSTLGLSRISALPKEK